MSKKSAGLSRRDLIKRGGAWGAAAAGMWALGPTSYAVAGAIPDDGKLRVRGAGGVLDQLEIEHVNNPFTKATGIDVELTFIQPAAKMILLGQSGGIPVDIVNAPAIVVAMLNAQGYIEQLDWSRFTTDRNDLVRTTDYYVPLEISADIIAFNTNKFGPGKQTPPGSWADLWDSKTFPGRRVLADLANSRPPLEIALLADGVAVADLYPLDLDRAFCKLEEIKPNILKFYKSAGEHDQLYSSELVDLGETLSGRVGALATAGAPYDVSWHQGVKSPQCYGIVKGTKMLDAAYQWLDLVMKPEVQAKFVSTDLMYAPANRKALQFTPPEWHKYLATSPEAEKTSFFLDEEWYAKNFDEVLKRWQQFTS